MNPRVVRRILKPHGYCPFDQQVVKTLQPEKYAAHLSNGILRPDHSK